MPAGDEAADIMLLDRQQDYAEIAVDRTRAWNFQQGTMLYWNPLAAETQFFFNDRDPQTARLFTVLYDLSLQTAAAFCIRRGERKARADGSPSAAESESTVLARRPSRTAESLLRVKTLPRSIMVDSLD
jgi:hypothetical protein